MRRALPFAVGPSQQAGNKSQALNLVSLTQYPITKQSNKPRNVSNTTKDLLSRQRRVQPKNVHQSDYRNETSLFYDVMFKILFVKQDSGTAINKR